MKEFHQQLKKAMANKNISQSELCEKTGIPKSAMSQYISGAFKPKQKRTYLIATALGVNEAWLLGYEDIPMNKTVNNSSHPKKSSAVNDISAEDKQILEMIKKLSPENKEIFVKFLKSL